jgi:hypothetical protein
MFVDLEHLGLSSPGELPLVTIAYLIAQKLHACTDHTDPERPNDRYRDLIDLILVDRLLRDKDRAGVREVCVEIFRLRDRHAWPPHITVPAEWPDGYRTLAESSTSLHRTSTKPQSTFKRSSRASTPHTQPLDWGRPTEVPSSNTTRPLLGTRVVH